MAKWFGVSFRCRFRDGDWGSTGTGAFWGWTSILLVKLISNLCEVLVIVIEDGREDDQGVGLNVLLQPGKNLDVQSFKMREIFCRDATGGFLDIGR